MKLVWVLALLVGVGCKSGPSEDQCKQLLDHLVDLEFKKGGAGTGSGDVAKQKTAVVEAKSSEFLETCTKKMARSRVECALAANDLDGENGVGRCDEAK